MYNMRAQNISIVMVCHSCSGLSEWPGIWFRPGSEIQGTAFRFPLR